MKKIFLMILLTTFSLFSFAEESALPCMEIKKACTSAGFKKSAGGISAKDCMSQILKGESVPGVNVKASVLKNCKEKHEK
jgi:hypothetical protein